MLAKHALSQLSYGPEPEDECSWFTSRARGLPGRSARQQGPPSPFGLRRDSLRSLRARRLVGLGRLELPTSRLSSARSNQLSYKPLTHIQSRTRDLQACSPSACSSAKKEKRRRRNPANAAQRS